MISSGLPEAARLFRQDGLFALQVLGGNVLPGQRLRVGRRDMHGQLLAECPQLAPIAGGFKRHQYPDFAQTGSQRVVHVGHDNPVADLEGLDTANVHIFADCCNQIGERLGHRFTARMGSRCQRFKIAGALEGDIRHAAGKLLKLLIAGQRNRFPR